MDHNTNQIRDLAKQYSILVIKDLAPDEINFVEPWVDGYIDSNISLEQFVANETTTDEFMGIGSIDEMAIALVVPIIVEIIKIYLPIIIEIEDSKETKMDLSDFQVNLNKEKDKIMLTIKARKGSNNKRTRYRIDKIFDILTKFLSNNSK